jgi:hypothetical protein
VFRKLFGSHLSWATTDVDEFKEKLEKQSKNNHLAGKEKPVGKFPKLWDGRGLYCLTLVDCCTETIDHQDILFNDLEHLLDAQDSFDVELHVENEILNAHKLILSMRRYRFNFIYLQFSPVFEYALRKSNHNNH